MSGGTRVLVAVDLYGEDEIRALEALDPRVQASRLDGIPGRGELENVEILFTAELATDAWLAPKLRWVQTFKAGIDDLPAPPAASRVLVTTTAGVLAAPIAEHVLALVLALVRRLPSTLEAQADRRWLTWKKGEYSATELTGKTIGVIGLGGIGRQVAWRAHAFGMHVLGVRRSATEMVEQTLEVTLENGARFETPVVMYPIGDLTEVLSRSDVVVVALPLTRWTQGLLDRDRLSHLRPGSILINASRGSIVDEDALVPLLESGILEGAGLDVFADEPLPAESPLWSLPNVIVTPHIAGVTETIGPRVLRFFEENLRRYLRGEPLANAVAPGQWDERPTESTGSRRRA